MPAWQRRIVLAMLVGLLAFLATLEPRHSRTGEVVWYAYLLFALPNLLAGWAALRRQPLVRRLPVALGLAAMLGLVIAWTIGRHANRIGIPDHFWFVYCPAEVLLFLLPLLIVRRWAGWRIGLAEEWARPEPPGHQFTLRQLLIWTAGTAGLLSLDRWITSLSPHTNGANWQVLLPLSVFAGFGLLWLLVLVPSIGLILGLGSRRRFAAWLAGMTALASLVPILVLVALNPRPPQIDEVLPLLVGMLAGFLPAVLGTLGVLRLCGYRLIRPKAGDLAVPPAAGVRPIWRRPFPYLVAAMGLLLVALVPVALELEAARKREGADVELQRKFEQCGVQAYVSGQELRYFQFKPNQPVTEEALQLIQRYSDRAIPTNLDISRRQLTDAQLARLADVRFIRLELAGNPISDQGLAQLKHPETINHLTLSQTQISDESLKWLAGCTNLDQLDLDGTQVTDAGLAHLDGLKRLQRLSLANTRVTAGGLREFRRVHPNCQVLSNTLPSPKSPSDGKNP